MSLFKTYMKLTPSLLLRNNIKLCIRAKHKQSQPVHGFLYLWRASTKVPKTPEEIKEVAEKYNLHPSEYKTYKPDDCCGDYPKLPLKGYELRDPDYPWDFPTLRRNFGEPVHLQEDLIGCNRDADAGLDNETYPIQIKKGLRWFIYGCILYIYSLKSQYNPQMEKQYPKPGVTYYTFEPLH